MMMVVVVRVVEGLLPINHALDVPKLLHVARDGDGALLIKAILLLSLLQELNEEWVIAVNHRHHKSLLLFTLAHLDCQAPFWNISDPLFLPTMMTMVMMVKVRQVQMEIS